VSNLITAALRRRKLKDASLRVRTDGYTMPLSKSIAFDEEQLTQAAAAVGTPYVLGEAEREFIERLKAGEADAFDVLVQRYSGDIYAMLCRMTEDAEEAADLTQETFMSSIKAIGSFRGESGLKTWLFRIAVNHARNRFRWWNRRQRNRSVSLDTSENAEDTPLSERIASSDIDPERAAIRSQREDAAIAELAKLPDIYREAIVLCDIEGMAYDEIAAALDINIGTVKSRLARGREELRKRLKDF
jgi:RNA polymerase sigma-70 factor (ECF subfamily)